MSRKNSLQDLPPEIEEGNVEYKLKLINPSKARLDGLITQLKWRLKEGNGEAVYELGIEDQGGIIGLTKQELESSKLTLNRMAKSLQATTQIIREKSIFKSDNDLPKYICEVLVRKVSDEQPFIDLRVAVLGNHGSGKSTMIGVLTRGDLDDGKGSARLGLFRHAHEVESGKTSSISIDVIGFDDDGQLINYKGPRTVEEVYETSTKLLTFLDLAGFYKYQKTTLFGLANYSPDYIMLLIDDHQGLVGTSREHLGLTLALNLPLFIIITKCDRKDDSLTIPSTPTMIISPNLTSSDSQNSTSKSPNISVLNDDKPIESNKTTTCDVIIEALTNINKVPLLITNFDQGFTAAYNMAKGGQNNCNNCIRIVPIIEISCVTGYHLDILTKFLQLLLPLNPFNNCNQNKNGDNKLGNNILKLDSSTSQESLVLASSSNEVEIKFDRKRKLSHSSKSLGEQNTDNYPTSSCAIENQQLIPNNNPTNNSNNTNKFLIDVECNDLAEFLIDEIFLVEECCGLVLSGIMNSGIMHENGQYVIGPIPQQYHHNSTANISNSIDHFSLNNENENKSTLVEFSFSNNQEFWPVCVKSIRRCRMIRKAICRGECATIEIQLLSTSNKTKGIASIKNGETTNSYDKTKFNHYTASHQHKRIIRETTYDKIGYDANEALNKRVRDMLSKIISKGMVILAPELNPKAVYRFEAEIHILYHATHLSANSQITVYVRNIRQTVILEKLFEQENLKTNESGTAVFRFLRSPQYLKIGSKLILREASMRGIGHITNIFYD